MIFEVTEEEDNVINEENCKEVDKQIECQSLYEEVMPNNWLSCFYYNISDKANRHQLTERLGSTSIMTESKKWDKSCDKTLRQHLFSRSVIQAIRSLSLESSHCKTTNANKFINPNEENVIINRKFKTNAITAEAKRTEVTEEEDNVINEENCKEVEKQI